MSEEDSQYLIFKENLYFSFVQLAFEHLTKMLDEKERLSELYELTLDPKSAEEMTSDDTKEYMDLRRGKTQECITVIVFSAMALEAYLLDYGARNLGFSYTKNHLDRLSIENKLIIIPRLVTGKKFPKDSQAYQHCKDLVSDRNWLIHYKPKKIRISWDTSTPVGEIKSEQQSLEKRAKGALKTLELVAKEVESIDPDEKAIKIIAPWLKTKSKKGNVNITTY